MTRPVFRILRLMLVTVTLASLSMTLPTRLIERAPAPLKRLLNSIAPTAEAAERYNGKIAFESHRDGNNEIYVMNASGTSQVNVSNNPAEDANPNWSYNGTKIAFNSDRDGNAQIYVMNANGTNQTRLTNTPSKDSFPAFSPDGTKIAFMSTRSGGDREICVMNANGSNQVQLTNNSAGDFTPDWSPDGTKILFRSDRDGNNEIYLMNADGSNQTNLTNDPLNDQSPSFSPDGTKIVFQRFVGTLPQVFVMNADGTNPVQLTSPDANFSGAFSPDGKQIVFTSFRDGNTQIYVMDADGSNQTRLTDNSTADDNPRWQPIPKRDTIGVFRPSTGQFLLRNTNAAGSADITIAFGQAGDQPLAGDWNNDGEDDVGVFRPSTGQFLLHTTLTTKFCASCNPTTIVITRTLTFVAQAGDQAVVGDWNGDGFDTIGVFRPSTSQWFLTNTRAASSTSPPVEITVPAFGGPGDKPLAGDWNGDGIDSIGVFRPSGALFFLSNNNATIDFTLSFGGPNLDLPVTGDWNGDGTISVGVFRPTTVEFFLNNSNTVQSIDITFPFGQSGDLPVAGDWNGPNQRPNSGVNSPSAGSNAPGQTQVFTTTCSDNDGWHDINTIDFKVVKSDGAGNGVPIALWAQFEEDRNRVRLYDPDLETWQEGVPGANVVLENRFVQLNLAGTQVQGSGPTGPSVQIKWQVVFKSAARNNNYKQFLKITDDAGLSTGFDKVGSWDITK